LKTHVIFVSGNSDPNTLAAANKFNPAGFIRKPFVADRFVMPVLEAVAPKNQAVYSFAKKGPSALPMSQ
jgi:DNA-binding NtrC family response regulator